MAFWHVAQVQGTNRAAIEGIGQVGAGGDGAVEALAGAGVVVVLEMKVGEFLVVAGRRVVEHHRFQFSDALPFRHPAGGSVAGAQFRQDLDDDVNDRADGREKDDEEDPKIIAAAALEEMHQRENRQQQRRERVNLPHSGRDYSTADCGAARCAGRAGSRSHSTWRARPAACPATRRRLRRKYEFPVSGFQLPAASIGIRWRAGLRCRGGSTGDLSTRPSCSAGTGRRLRVLNRTS